MQTVITQAQLTHQPPAGYPAPLSDFSFDEKIKPTEVPYTARNVLRISTPAGLTERRIYCYVEVKGPTASDQYVFGAEIVAFNHGVVVGRFPVVIGNIITSTTNQSILSLFNAGGSPVGDSLVVRLANPFDTTSSGIQVAVIQPLRVNAEVDEITFSILQAGGTNLAGWRALLACLSTKY